MKLDINFNQHTFQFTKDWFRGRNARTFTNKVRPAWAGKAAVYLEIGVWEGQSLVWMLQHVLTNPNSRAYGVDPWLMQNRHPTEEMEANYVRARHNLAPWAGRCSLHRATSHDFLQICTWRQSRHFAPLRPGQVDICMIDGNHDADTVARDAAGVLQMLRPGGWMLFDDVVDHPDKPGAVWDGIKEVERRHTGAIKHLWKDGQVSCYEKL